MSDQEPFANVSEDVPLACAPLGGVPRAVLAGVLWTRANITKLGIAQIQDPKRRTYKIGKRTFRPGVVEVDPRPRWKEELKVGVSVDEIRKRSERPRRERLVTQVVGGEALWTGFNRLDHDVVTAELVAQGYKLISTDTLTYKLDREVFRKSLEKPTSIAAIVELFELQK
jgi:hypothetical protein